MTSINVSNMTFYRKLRQGRRSTRRLIFEALNLNFVEGEKVGIIGPNGSGKTTLLRLLSGILAPDIGTVNRAGQFRTIIDAGFGLDPMLSGADNIRSWSFLRGRNREEARHDLVRVKEFSELGEKFDDQVRTFSTGMVMRLVVSAELTLHNGEGLIIDEGFGAADVSFQAKAHQMIETILKDTTLLIMTSHNESMLCEFCERGIVLSGTQVAFDGSIREAFKFYKGH